MNKPINREEYFEDKTPEYLLDRLESYAKNGSVIVKRNNARWFLKISPQDAVGYGNYLENLGLVSPAGKWAWKLDLKECISYLRKREINPYEKIPELRETMELASKTRKAMKRALYEK